MSFRLRDARLEDVAALAALHVQTFNETHRRGQPGGPSHELREAQWRDALTTPDPGRFCVVIEDEHGQLVGFAKGIPHDGGIPDFEGELNKIYLLRRVQRQGLGRLLLGAVATRFLRQGVASMLLFGDATSPANQFYEAHGAERLHGPNGEFHGAYGWRDLRPLVDLCGMNGGA